MMLSRYPPLELESSEKKEAKTRMIIVLQYTSAFFAFFAAILWFVSAIVKTPTSFSIHVARPQGLFGQPLGGDPFGGT